MEFIAHIEEDDFPIEEVMFSVADDIAHWAASGDLWDAALAWGTECRYQDPDEQTSIKVGNLEAGLLIAEVDILHQLLDDQRFTIRPDDEDWCASLKALCERRDQLESVYYTLGINFYCTAPEWLAIREAVAEFDRRGEAFVMGLPAWKLINSITLEYLAYQGHQGWWVDPARNR